MVADYLVPVLMLFICGFSMYRKQDTFSIMTEGAQDGLRLLLSVAPTLILLLSAVRMLRVSGFFDLAAALFAPVCRLFGIPPELMPLMLVRPVSGSAALAVGAELIGTYGADSCIGRCAAVMLGSTETTFYTISVYFGAAGLKGTRWAIPAAVAADLTGFFCACLFVRLFFP